MPLYIIYIISYERLIWLVDILFKRCTIIDGTGRAPYKSDIAVKNGKIMLVNKRITSGQVSPKIVIDIEGKVICPGFVDTHTHSDMILLYDRQHVSGLSQGVTTEIIGQDGLSYAPLSEKNLCEYSKYLRGLNGIFPVPLDFNSVKQYREKLNNQVAINTAYLFPHCAARLETVGFKDIPLVGADLDKAKDILKQGMIEGAKGLSTGLSYFPGAFSDTNELVELSKVIVEYSGVYATHLRTVYRGKPFDGVAEAIEIARRSGVKLHFSHYKTGPATLGHPDEIMEKIYRAVSDGIDISLELYPYLYGSSFAAMFLPYWANDGGFDAIMQHLSDKKTKKLIADHIDRENLLEDGIICNLINNTQYIGMKFSEVAALRNQTKGQLICDLLYEEQLAFSFYEVPPKDLDKIEDIFISDLLGLLDNDYYMVGSDAIFAGDNPHPRTYGSFTKLLRICRERGVKLEKIINRMTGLPCKRFNIKKRGIVKEGYFADLVVFDPQTVTDTSTPSFSRNLSRGIEYVVVNGKFALYNSGVTGIFAGRSL